MDRAGVVAAEALLVSVAQRFLIGRFQKIHVTRGEGAVVFSFDRSAVPDTKTLGECVERMLVAIVKELCGRTKLALGDDTIDFNDVGAKSTVAKTFANFMNTSVAGGGGGLELTELPPHPAVSEMLEVLYTEAATEVTAAETIKDFPKHLCPEGVRYDYIVKKKVIVRAFSKTSTLLIPSEDLSAALSAQGSLNESVALQNAGNDTSLNAAGTVVFSGECGKILIEASELAKMLAIHSSAPVEEHLPQQWRSKTFSIDEAPEVLRAVYLKMIDFWRNNTHTDKLRVNAISLLQIVTGDVRTLTTERILLESRDYAGPWRMTYDVMEKCSKLCATWRQYLLDLVERDWVDWDGGHYRDDGFEHYADRLKAAVRIRGLYEAAELLMNNNATVLYEIRPDVVFDGKSVVDTKQCSRDQWRKCCDTWEQRFSLVETALAGQMKGLLGSAPAGEARSRIMQQFNVLMRREAVRSAVESDIASAYASIQDRMRLAQSKFHEEKGSVSEGDAQSMLIITRRCMAEVGPAVDTSRAIFHPNSDQYKSVEDLAAAISAEIVAAEKSSVTQWIQTIEGRCSRIAGLEAAVTFEVGSDGCFLSSKMSAVVQGLCDDVLRIRGSLVGPKPSVRVQFSTSTQRTLDDAEKLLKHHMRSMRLIAAFNSAVDQILPVTREMLHEHIERCVTAIITQGKNNRMFAFSQGADLDAMNVRFQAAAEAFSAESRAIRRGHVRFTETVNDLFSVDLLRNPDQWRATLKDLREDFDTFEKRQSNPKTMLKWRRHWDFQLYKALEHQYQKGLESLDQNMQEFNVEMIFKQGQVQLKPGYEALREAYYAKLREFVNIPQRFKGVGGTSEIFTLMPAMNAAGITAVHQKAMELFNKISKVRRQFRDLVVVGVCGTNGAPDLGTIVDAATSKIEDWEEGYKMIKERAKRLNYVEDQIKVDCVTISTAPIKATIADHLHKLEGSLTHALRRTMQSRLAHIDDFVLFASNIIERQPTTLDEVGKANQAYNKFKELVPQYQAQLNEVDTMNQLIKQHAGAAFEMGVTRSRWEHLMDAMASHHEQIDASVKKMRVSVDAMIAKFLKDLQRFSNNWNKNKPQGMDSFKSRQDFVDKGLKYVKEQHAELQEYVTNGKELESKCEYFRMGRPDFILLEETTHDISTHEQMWSLFEKFEEELDKLRKEDWLTYRSRTYSFEELLREWREKVAQHVAEKGGGEQNLVTKHITTLIDEWSTVVPLLKFVRGDGMLPEHWAEMFRYLGIEKGMTSDKLSFGDILAKHQNVVKHEVELKGLHARAQGEVQIRDAIQELRTWAMEATFTLITPQESTNKVQLISEWKDVMTQVSDNQALIGSLKDSPFFPRFADEASGWEAKLVAVSEYLVLLNSIQRKWTYLEPLFARGALPHEQPRFKRVDKEFVSILRDVEADPRIMTLAQHTDYSDKLKNILEQIERCQKALSEFLEQKRDKFPRFYFISDDDLLEILGQSKNPTVIQSHLKKLFAGINSVKFDDHKNAITHMVSADGEVVPLLEKVSITDNNVEDWLIRLDTCMRSTLRDLLAKCVAEKDATTPAALEKYPSQILQVAEQIFFVADAEAAIPSAGKAAVANKLKEKLRHLTGLNLHGKPVTELKAKALILDVIHNIEVIELLMEKSVRDTASWWWQKQLRYYVDKSKQGDDTADREGVGCVLRMVDTEFRYTFEYQGNALKLVHTPLTDKCYLVLTKGMHLGYGGNPYGPAGTGKTESVKALGSAMGRQVLVFNCDEGIDFKAMGRIFVGIVKCGAWGCFDEFNRLKVDQLSAISQMIQAIQETLKNGEPSCTLLNRTIDINPNSGIFVTLNPAGKGYGGRTKLPDNLKQLFRAVAMSVPDNELITSTMLQSEGFLFAKQISKKVVDVYALSKQLMSSQQHYDWGLRPLKAVLRLGGTLLQQFRYANPEAKTTEDQECEFMVQSLRINTISKLTFDDGRLFNGLIADIFPKIAIKEISYKELEVAIEAAAKALGLQHINSQVHKVLQLYESMNQRMGVVLVGPSGSGKSTLLRILRKALQIMNVSVPMHVVNPKALPRQQLLGHMDPDTREWFDGVLSAAARKVVKEAQDVRSWIFCDGDIDPEWVESLNSVLDDNKLLTMPNGVRIQFGSNVNFVFETHSLEFASPATVSRMGIIFLSEQDVHPKYSVASFMAQKLSEERRAVVEPMITQFLYPAIEELVKMNSLAVGTTRKGLLTAALNHVTEAVNPFDFACCLVRGLGSVLRAEAQEAFATKVFAICGEVPEDAEKPLNSYFNREKKKKASFSSRNIAKLTPTDLVPAEKPMVRTVEVERLMTILEPLAKDPACKPFFIVGPDGCGKSMILRNCFIGASEKGVNVSVIHCSAQTSAQHVIQKITQLCAVYSTNAGKVLRPKEGDRLVICLKDVNLPKPDRYGTVQLHSFIQQLLLYQGYYDNELEWVGIERIQIVASMNPIISAGRFPVAPRLLAIVNIICMPYPSRESLVQVYTTFFGALLKSPQLANGPQYDNGQQLAAVATTVFENIKKRFEGEEYAHCVFSPRDITQWACSLQNYSVEATDVASLLYYEACRIFVDRLAGADDRSRAEKMILEQLSTIGFSGGREKDDKERPYFASWASEWPVSDSASSAGGAGAGALSLKPLKLTPYAEVEKEVKNAMNKYRHEFRDLAIPPISEILGWIPRLDRVLVQNSGHVLLVGHTGVGRRAAVTIASYMLRMSVAAINMGRDYSLKAFRSDLRAILQRAAAQNERVTLVIEDHNFTQEAFIEMINSLVSSGEVPGLFNPEELEQMMAPLREEASNEGFIGNMHSFFLQRVAKNLRVAVIMDPRNPLFAPRCQANPGLLTCCAVQWFGSWNSDTTRSICKYTLRKVIKEIESDSNFKGFALHREMLWIHESLEGFSKVTPQHFQTLMATYESIFNSKGKASGDALARLEAGLAKLKEAERDVDKIKSEVGIKKTDLERKQAEGNVSMEKIQANLSDSAEQREQAAVLEEQLKKEAAEIQIKKEKAEGELASSQPILDAAKEAIGNVDPKALSEIASLPKPPETIVAILEGVLGLFGIADSAWGSMKKFLTERGVKERIQNFDAKGLSPAIRSSVNKIIQQKSDCFRPEVAMRASKAAAPLAAWVKANVEYATVLERIGPLTNQLAQLEASQKKGEADLAELKKQLEKIDKNVEKLRKDFAKNCKEAERLKEGLEKAEHQLETAQSLLEKLTGEKVRWSNDAAVIKEKQKQMPRRALLCAAFLTYLTKYPEDQRSEWLRKWSEKLGFASVPLVTDFMRNESQLLQYKSEGLPADNLSQENAVAILDAIQTPLVVDPANQAVEWLKNNLKSRDVTTEVSSIADDRFAHTLELAIRFGKTLLVTEVDKIDPMLYPILRRDLNTAGPKYVVQLGSKQVDWQESFKIVLFSRSASLQLTADSASLVSEVNFSVTRSGLESQLLGITIQRENPELETQKVELLQQEDALQMQLAKLEETLLADLANSSGDLLQNTQLIDSLNLIKTQAHTIGESLARSKELQIELDRKRDVYRPFAKKGSTVFFIIKDLNTLNRMYEFSLSSFLDHFKETLDGYQQQHGNAKGADNIAKKIEALSLGMAQRAFLSVSLGLFKADRIEFAMHVVRHFFPERFPEKHWTAFIGSLVGDEERAAQRVPSWAFPSSKVAFSSILALEDGEALVERWKLNDGGFWEAWIKDPSPEKLLISRRSDLSDMDRLLIVGAFRRDRLVAMMTYVALTNLDVPALAEVTTIESFVSSSKADTPLLLITSSGADPSIEVQEIAHKTVGKTRFIQIALGGGQTDEAMIQLRRCAANGDWIFLKNLHLVLDWVAILEKEVSSMAAPHPEFRLFMTTEAHDLFPTVLLQSCDKMTIEAPPGVKQNLLRSYSTWTTDFLGKLTQHQSQILFGLAWFHAIVQERRTYIPQGWVKFYEFTQADLKSASDIVLMMSGASNKSTCDWVAIQGLFESAIYGGRLDNDQDNKVLSVFLRKIFNENVLINCSQPLSQTVDIPKTNSHDSIVRHIFGKVSDVDAPSTFNLPHNADRAVQEGTATKNLQNLRLLSNVSAVASSASAEALKGILDPILALWESTGLVKLVDSSTVPTIPAEVENPSPMQVFFVSEITLLATLIGKLSRRFAELRKVRDGVVIPTDDLRHMATTLATGQCPEAWTDWMTGPTSSSLWLQLLKRRFEAVQHAYSKLGGGELLSSKIRLTDFLRPHTFLNALRQHTARHSGEPMVQLVLACYPAASTAARKSSVPVLLDGSVMALQGAMCSGDRLSPVDNNAPSSSRFVDLTVGWIRSESFTEEGFVQLPVYLSQERELHLMNVQMPCASQPEKDSWILSGAAIFLTP